ncbi:MAG TPA: hypothetical protein VGB15_16655 [Longimicrobium sp.]|jgi:hypothetical protein
MNSFLGSRGEGIFSLLITESYSESAPLFVPEFLGEAWPVVDYIVRLRGVVGSVAPYFFVQVKTTRRGYTRSGRLKASISAREMKGLVANPVPTYIVGVDERARVAFLVSANGEHQRGLASLPAHFPLDRSTQEALWDEVNTFWKSVAPARFVSRFSDPGRREG